MYYCKFGARGALSLFYSSFMAKLELRWNLNRFGYTRCCRQEQLYSLFFERSRTVLFQYAEVHHGSINDISAAVAEIQDLKVHDKLEHKI